MRKTKISFLKFLYAMVMGLIISAFSFGASTAGILTVNAQEAQGNVAVMDEEVPLSENADDDNSSMVFLLLGGMLILIIAVVITVVASFVTTAPIADEI